MKRLRNSLPESAGCFHWFYTDLQISQKKKKLEFFRKCDSSRLSQSDSSQHLWNPICGSPSESRRWNNWRGQSELCCHLHTKHIEQILSLQRRSSGSSCSPLKQNSAFMTQHVQFQVVKHLFSLTSLLLLLLCLLPAESWWQFFWGFVVLVGLV